MTSSLLRAAAPFALAVGTALALAGPALAQTQSPSQVPPGQTLERRSPSTSFRFPAAQGLTAPEGAAAIRFALRDLQVEGGLAPLEARTQALKPAVGAEVSVAEVYDYAAALQAAYLDAGYPLVRVVVPAQDLERETGIVRVLVVSGFVERIDVEGLPRAVRGRVQSVLAPLLDRRPLRAAEFERRLLLAGETAGVALESALSPGTRTGGTVLIIGGEHRPVQVALALDNGLSEDLGREQATGSVALNSLLGLGERIILTGAVSPDDVSWSDDTLRRYASIYAELPIGRDGLSLGGEYAYSASSPQGSSAPLLLQSDFTRAGAFVSLATVRSRVRSQTVRLTFDASEEEQTTGLLGFPLALFTDRTRVARLGIDGSEPIILDGRLGYELEVSQGFDGLGARSIDEATPLRPLSRFGADAAFTRLQGGLSVLMPLGGAFSAQSILRGQTGFGDPLLRSEQGNIASGDLVSGPPAGSLVGDDTFAGRIEVRRSVSLGRAALLPYVFSAAGRTWLKTPLVGEREQTDTGAIGAGVRFEAATAGRASVFGRLEWSHVESEQTFADRNWVSVSLTLRY
ncbi:ShlB/FhaC/HecB family hemolysin secretion/activation protein [Brevundimonas subvibrioides]|uniref:Polypeptide-transport-associated domain protein ShlB-type n=1 Tax=Brevundimonas subvibrioides (strain ATCC 15264 / DSM 4735 / LMG 14903 / NBRC 16000 / CB 81) TaxID=633149 RepID=D9QJW9_BRESC|nr:ShlB/FhaC/HecB family hemolysin secretion/activation protein [Brevundimonas subvibrioides]ADK99720.1 Polypeptide-transport-associated domain protein ShlB-type [Brevundimonas subvibrioides ATCC 15264]